MKAWVTLRATREAEIEIDVPDGLDDLGVAQLARDKVPADDWRPAGLVYAVRRPRPGCAG